MPLTVLFASLPVTDLAAATAWHEAFHGREPEMRPNGREACWQVSEAGWVYVVVDGERAGRGLVTVVVDDLEARVTALAERGLSPVATEDGRPRKAFYEDPDGNRLVLGQP